MEFASIQDLCLQLISSAIRRCRCSEQLCRLSVIMHCSRTFDPSLVRISISDTGHGSCLEEFQDLKCPDEAVFAGKWDGIVSVRTTDICDDEIRCYQLNMKENVTTRTPICLTSNVKHGMKFSGTEVCLSVSETIDALVAEINCFFQKILILRLPNIAMEVVVKHESSPGSGDDATAVFENLSPGFSFTASTLENLRLGLEDYVLSHGSSLMCYSCFPNRDNLKSGSGTVIEEKHKVTTVAVEAAVVISDIQIASNCCFRAPGSQSKVLCFKDFAPCSISEACLKALTSIDWKKYGLILERAINQKNHALLNWENMPSSFQAHIAVHCYYKKAQFDSRLFKKAVKLALDDLKNKHAGYLLSAHAHKIRRYAPDLAKTIAGLVSSSNDADFQKECLTILGLKPQHSGSEIIEEYIKKKIISVIEASDRRPQGTREAATNLLFEDDHRHHYQQLRSMDDLNDDYDKSMDL